MAPSSTGFSSSTQKTGVDWCELTVTPELLGCVHTAQSNETLIRAMDEPALEQLVRGIVTDEVSAATALAANPQIDTDELCERCFALMGEPFSEAPARRDMRERIRVFQRIERCGNATPTSLDDVLDLWSEAMQGEVRFYEETEIAQFRRNRIPFAHTSNPFEYAKPPAGYETVEAPRIPAETKALLAFMNRNDLPLEILAAASHFLCGHIHPFSDGNGRLSRMLACILLSGGYSHATVLAFLRRLQADRNTMSLTMARTVRTCSDLEEAAQLFLRMLCAAQRDLLPSKPGFAHLPLRPVRTEGLELLAARNPDRKVYRADDGRIVKMLARRGRLGRASAVYEAISAACAAGAAIARPDELVRTETGYAMVLECVNGLPLADLVARGQVSPEEAGAAIARCLLGLHALQGDEARMRDVREPFLDMVEDVSPWLSTSTAKALRSFILDIPAAATIVHGDAHMGNVIIRADGTPTLIDADTVSMGAPVFDLACAYSTMICEAAIDPVRAEGFHDMPIETVKAVWESLMHRYRAGTDMTHPEETNRQMQVLAWLVVLNRMSTSGTSAAAFGEKTLRILKTISCLTKALGRTTVRS